MMSSSNINKQYGKQLLFGDASFQLNPGEKVGLGGPNGAGKKVAMHARHVISRLRNDNQFVGSEETAAPRGRDAPHCPL
jgi:ATPase subunit of ABC transporter with duplicated ATPase domains